MIFFLSFRLCSYYDHNAHITYISYYYLEGSQEKQRLFPQRKSGYFHQVLKDECSIYAHFLFLAFLYYTYTI
jgi:hypothetical protein